MAEPGPYTFQTRGFFGSCGLAGLADTVLDLYGPTGALIASNDDEPGLFRFCSRIERGLEPGTYRIRVSAIGGGGLFSVLAGRH